VIHASSSGASTHAGLPCKRLLLIPEPFIVKEFSRIHFALALAFVVYITADLRSATSVCFVELFFVLQNTLRRLIGTVPTCVGRCTEK